MVLVPAAQLFGEDSVGSAGLALPAAELTR